MTYEETKKEFVTLITKGAYRFRTWEIFTDFCQMGAISLSQPFKRSKEDEKEYLKLIGKYNKEEVTMFPQLLALVVQALSEKMGDFLGECFTELNLSSKYKGQFFTPYHISKLMASLHGKSDNEIEKVSDPCCGSGSMIIARAEALKDMKINYQRKMVVQAVDVDSLCVAMCYIQLSLLHIPAQVIHGNSLTLETFRTWYTPAYFMSGIGVSMGSSDKDKTQTKQEDKKQNSSEAPKATKLQEKTFSEGDFIIKESPKDITTKNRNKKRKSNQGTLF